MRILQTGDWHIDVSPNTAPRFQDHAHLFSELLQIIERERIDVLLQTGDIFDRVQVSSRGLLLLAKFLSQASRIPSLKSIVLITGNHDSNRFFEALSPLLTLSQKTDFHVISNLKSDIEEWKKRCIIPLPDQKTTLVALPYLSRNRLGIQVSNQNAVEINQQLQQSFRSRLDALATEARKRYPKTNLIAAAHLSCAENDGQDNAPRKIYLGETLPPSVFPKEYIYVALGHFHSCISLDQGRVWYAGTPITTCLAESTTRHALIADIEDGILRQVTKMPIPHFRVTYHYSGSFHGLVDALSVQPQTNTLYLYADITDAQPSNAELSQFLKQQELNIRLVRLRYTEKNTSLSSSVALLENLDPMTVFRQIYIDEEGDPPSEELLRYFAMILEDCAYTKTELSS